MTGDDEQNKSVKAVLSRFNVQTAVVENTNRVAVIIVVVIVVCNNTELHYIRSEQLHYVFP